VPKRTQGSEIVVAEGLKPGEKVVTDGQQRLVNGAKVEVGTPGAPRPGRGPGGAPPSTPPAPPPAPKRP